jgi:hypothetical protein
VGGAPSIRANGVQLWSVVLEEGTVPNGQHTLKVEAFGGGGTTEATISVTVDLGPTTGATRPQAGVLFYANFGNEDETRVLANPSIVGALFQVYWSEFEPERRDFRWKQLDDFISRWRAAGKKVAVRVLWSSSGYWPDPTAKRPTPKWVWDVGARFAYHAQSDTEIPLFWDPIYREHAGAFLDALSARYDGNPDVMFIDATPGAETNPYRFGTIDQNDPGFRAVFVQTAASDGTTYTDERWELMVAAWLRSVRTRFPTLPVLITLNRGAMPDAPSRLAQIGDLAVSQGFWVGQNGLKGSSYTNSASQQMWLDWGSRARLFFETAAATGAEVGTMEEVVDAAIRVGADFLNVYAVDVVRATPGASTYDPAWEAALIRAAARLR